jgi:hypothetical protein
MWDNGVGMNPFPSVNYVETGAASAGGWGGSCTCPNGEVYWVGDMVPGGCGAGINCVNGVAGTCGNCQDANGVHQNCWQRRVTCNPITALTST